MTDAIEIKWTETKAEEKSMRLQWQGDRVVGFNYCSGLGPYAHERDIPESWKTEKPELYTQLRHYIWQHRELVDGEFLDHADGVLGTLRKSDSGFEVLWPENEGRWVPISESVIRENATNERAPRSWPRALDYARRHSEPVLADDEYQFPHRPVFKMRVDGCLLEVTNVRGSRQELVRFFRQSTKLDRPVWQRILDFYDREMCKGRVWSDSAGHKMGHIGVARGRIDCTFDQFLPPDTALEVADHIKALAEVLKTQSEAKAQPSWVVKNCMVVDKFGKVTGGLCSNGGER